MDFKFTQAGKIAFDKFEKAIDKTQREYVKRIGNDMKPVLKRAVQYGKALTAAVFGGRGKRFVKAFHSQIRFKPDNLEARLGFIRSRVKSRWWWWLGRIYQFGATITAKNRKGLWIPIGSNRTGEGRPVITARQYFNDFRGRGVVKMSQRGNLIAFGKDGDELVPMFVLKDSVRINPRPSVTNTANLFLPEIQDAAATTLFNNFKK